jgi:hypothetical protein
MEQGGEAFPTLPLLWFVPLVKRGPAYWREDINVLRTASGNFSQAEATAL